MAQVLATTELLESWLGERNARGKDLFDYKKKGVFNGPPALSGEHRRNQFSLEAQRIGDGGGDQRFRQSMSFAVSRNATASAS